MLQACRCRALVCSGGACAVHRQGYFIHCCLLSHACQNERLAQSLHWRLGCICLCYRIVHDLNGGCGSSHRVLAEIAHPHKPDLALRHRDSALTKGRRGIRRKRGDFFILMCPCTCGAVSNGQHQLQFCEGGSLRQRQHTMRNHKQLYQPQISTSRAAQVGRGVDHAARHAVALPRLCRAGLRCCRGPLAKGELVHAPLKLERLHNAWLFAESR